MNQSVFLFLCACWGSLAAGINIFLRARQQERVAPARYLVQLFLRYSVIVGFALTLQHVLHGDITLFAGGFGLTTLLFVAYTVGKALWI